MGMESSVLSSLPVLLLVLCAIGLAIGLLVVANLLNPGRPTQVEQMTYESGMDPIHDTRRRFDVRFHLLAVAFLIFDVELLFLYPWAVMAGGNREMGTSVPISANSESMAMESDPGGLNDENATNLQLRSFPRDSSFTMNHHRLAFLGAMTFLALLTVGYVYDWRKGVFQWR
jgi:NADH-quinone oxidoreductase subunit A